MSDIGLNVSLDQSTHLSKIRNPPKVYTVACAVRTVPSQKVPGGLNQTSNESRMGTCKQLIDHQSSIVDTAIELKETIKIKRKVTIQKQPRSTLPMKMIVSKKATRNREIHESSDDYDSIDLSACRNYKLTPPPWLNRSNNVKRRRPTETENIIEEMKKRCEGFNAQSNSKMTRDSNFQEIGGLLYSQGNKENILLNTPRNEHAFNQLYCSKQTKLNRGVASFYQEKLLQQNQPANCDCTQETEKSKEKFIFNPILFSSMPKEPEFIWNPVILDQKTKSQPNLVFEARNDTFDFQRRNSSVDVPSSFTPSSSSSGLTVEEETLRYTMFTKRGGNEFLNIDHRSSNLMPRPLQSGVPKFGRTRTDMTYSKLPELYRFYEE